MGRRREEKVDEEELARLMGNVEGESSKIRVKMPNVKVKCCQSVDLMHGEG